MANGGSSMSYWSDIASELESAKSVKFRDDLGSTECDVISFDVTSFEVTSLVESKSLTTSELAKKIASDSMCEPIWRIIVE